MSLEMTAETRSDAQSSFHNAFLNTSLRQLKGPNTLYLIMTRAPSLS